ncbi:MAG TPA: zinc-binding dehydrogenase, partial [Acetobacteraceae bacterium]|nr:zinc-binding dehydrogenase [Acetobacteraceae bacterium]
VHGWTVGARAGVGWFGGSCGYCSRCRRDSAFACENVNEQTGVTRDGGYATHMVARMSALAHRPAELDSVEAAPLLCAGVTTFNALRESGARPGDLVAIQGIGGLGHLGVQFAVKMGFRTVAIARGSDKEKLARQLGAHIYIDSATQDAAAELAKLGGAKTILSTVTSGKAMSELIPGLSVRGRLVVIGVGPDPLQVSTVDLIMASRSVTGHASGASIDSEDTLAFSVLTGVRPTIETMKLERAAEAYDKMMRGEAVFRMVLTMD